MVNACARHMSLPATATTRLLITSAPISHHGVSCQQPAGHMPITLLCPLLAGWLCGHGRSGRCHIVKPKQLCRRWGDQLLGPELCLLLLLPCHA